MKIVVVGNGMVGHRFCDRLSEYDLAREHHVVCFGEEPRPAYDRVHLSEFFSGRTAEELSLADGEWYRSRGIELNLSERVTAIDPARKQIQTDSGRVEAYDALVLATGSSPFVPPLAGIDLPGVFVYRTIEDLESIRSWGQGARRAAVIGGGLLGLEAAKALVDMRLEAHVVEFAPRLMPRQVDQAGGEILRESIERLGVRVHVGVETRSIAGAGRVERLCLGNGTEIEVDMVVVSAGIRPRDELARAAGLSVGERGGIAVSSALQSSDPAVFCIGECALVGGMVYGLVAPGYQMADALASRLCGGVGEFTGADLSTKLKLLGIEVASFGNPFADEALGTSARRIVYEDRASGVYQKLVVTADGARLLGGILVGDASAYFRLFAAVREGATLPERPQELLFGSGRDGAGEEVDTISDASQICSCNNVSKGQICDAVRSQGLSTLGEVKACTKAGTGCGGCVPFVAKILDAELASSGRQVNRSLCEHFPFTRPELFQAIKINHLESFDQVLRKLGSGGGCEVCRPAVASILASQWNDFVLEHATIQDTNDRFLANIQRGGTYSVIPRIPGGEITADKLIVLGQIAKKFELYCKITGGQRIDLLGAHVDDLPAIWEDLVEAGFESGHAYGKAMRTVKSCIGSTWCRFGVQDSTALAIRIEERYRGLRAPHKLKSAVSGCIRECAEAQSKDFGIIATEKGWNLYVCGNGGSQPRHADLLAADLDEESLVRLIDRFLMYYIHTANPLERTARWLERLDGGLAELRRVIIDDALHICDQLERDMQQLVDTYECEWAAVVRDPDRRRAFKHFANRDGSDPNAQFVVERSQKRPVDWANPAPPAHTDLSALARSWVALGQRASVPADGGTTMDYEGVQIAVFHFATTGKWYATQAMCPHRKDMVLARGLLGTQGETPKVACPLHKKTFSLTSGDGLSDPDYRIHAFPVEIRGEQVFVELPPAESLRRALCSQLGEPACASRASLELPAQSELPEQLEPVYPR